MKDVKDVLQLILIYIQKGNDPSGMGTPNGFSAEGASMGGGGGTLPPLFLLIIDWITPGVSPDIGIIMSTSCLMAPDSRKSLSCGRNQQMRGLYIQRLQD